MKHFFLFIIFNFYSFSFVFIDPNIEQYFNQDYIKEVRKLNHSGDFYLFEIDKNEKKFTIPDKYTDERGIDITQDLNFTIYRSTSKANCNSYNETTKSNELINNVYLDVVVENIEKNDGLLYVENFKDDPKQYLKNHYCLRYEDKNYIDLTDRNSIIFKIVVEEKDPVKNDVINKKEIYCFLSDTFTLFGKYPTDDKYWHFDSFKYSLFDNEKIVEFYLINPLMKIKDLVYIDENRNKTREPNNYKTEINGETEGDINNFIFYDDDDIDKKSELQLRETFKNCLNLRKISFENNDRYDAVSNDIFIGCQNLEELEIRNIFFWNLNYFRNFHNLKSLILNDKNKIHKYSFANCEKLKEIKFVNDDYEENIIDELIVENAGFKNCPELQYIGAKKIIIDSQCGNTSIFEKCKKLKIPDVVVLLHKNVNLEYPNLKNIFNGLDPNLNEDVKLEFKYVDDSSKIRYNLDFNMIFNGCKSKKNISIEDKNGNKITLTNLQNNDKIDEFLLNPERYLKHRKFYQKCSKEQLAQYNYFEGINLDNEEIRNKILNNTYNINNDLPNIDSNLNKDIPKDTSCLGCCGKCFSRCCCCCCNNKQDKTTR